jgi:NitT/TauT family transport system permease protein
MRRLLNIHPRGGVRLLLGVLPVLAVVLLYLGASTVRHIDNPRDQATPTPFAMIAAVAALAHPDPADGRAPLATDTEASLGRLAAALIIAAAVTLVFGLALGLLPFKRAAWSPLIAALAAVPPIALLPILCAAFGAGETAKIALIVLGVTPFMVRDLTAHIAAIPEAQIVKAQTLGASTWQTALRVALPQALPRLIASLRLSLGPAWVLLIAAEAIAARHGLGYRIFAVGRGAQAQGQGMDVIVPYVAWISLLAVGANLLLDQVSRRAFAWAHPGKAP